MPNHSWGQPFNTNGYNGYWPNPGVKTDGIGMPLTRQDADGNRPILIGSIYRGYAAGPASIWQGMYYQGVETQGNSWFGASGGAMSFFIRGSAGTLRFGRDEGAGRNVVSENDGGVWGGTLAGSLDWAQVAAALSIPQYQGGAGNRTISFGDWSTSDEGGSGIHTIYRQMQTNGGSWGSQTSAWNTPYVGTPGNTYRFRFSGVNGVGWSAWAYTITFSIPFSGGRRMTSGSASTPLTTSKRFNGSSWVDLTTRKRHNGSTWVDITN